MILRPEREVVNLHGAQRVAAHNCRGAAPILVLAPLRAHFPPAGTPHSDACALDLSSQSRLRAYRTKERADSEFAVSAVLERCPRTMTGVSQCWFSGHFKQVFFNTNALPRINIGADVWGESSIMTGVY